MKLLARQTSMTELSQCAAGIESRLGTERQQRAATAACDRDVLHINIKSLTTHLLTSLYTRHVCVQASYNANANLQYSLLSVPVYDSRPTVAYIADT